MLADVIRQLQVPQSIVVTRRPDMVFYSKCEHIIYFIDLTIPFGESDGDNFQTLLMT